jgi:hypothetical protein
MNRAINKQSIQNTVMIGTSNIMEKSTAVVGQAPTASQPGKSKWTGFAKLAFFGLVALSMVGCVGRFTGGGSIDSVAGAPQKATFGFVINAVNPDEAGNPTAIKGQFQYNDHGAGVSFHVAQLEPALYARIIFAPSDPAVIPAVMSVIFAYSGTYTCNQGSGELELGVASDKQVEPFSGQPNMDAVFVTVLTGPYAGYENVGLVQNGKIQFKPAKAE